jgi:perosamine synthetase
MNVYGGAGVIIPHSRPFLDQDDVAAVSEVLSSGEIAQGEKVREFEDGIARFVGAKYGVACSSGTAALHLALLGLGVGAGDEVVMPSYVCSSPYFATVQAGALPKIADIDIADFNLSVESAKKQLAAKTKAMIVPHMFGTAAEIDDLLELGVPVIEDCAQSLGAEYRGRRVGSYGAVSTFSFYATKMIAAGEGGMVLTSSREFYGRLVDLRDYDKKPLVPAKYNYKMTDFQAALGLSQLRKLERFIERRTEIARVYTESFSKYDVELPTSPSYKKSVFFRYIVKLSDMRRVQDAAKRKGVVCEKPVFQPLHSALSLKGYPNSDAAREGALSIPLYPALTENEVEYVVSTLGDVFAQKHRGRC